MSDKNCPDPGCGKPTNAVLVEDGVIGGEARLFPVTGVVWCPSHGVSEARVRPGRSGPVRLGRFLKSELNHDFPPTGQRVWREHDGTTPSDMMRRGPPNLFYLRVAGLRWDRATETIVPIHDMGSDFFVRPDEVDRNNGSAVPHEVEVDLKRRDSDGSS